MSLLTSLLKTASESAAIVKKNSPLILTVAGIGLGATSTVMAVKATPKAYDIYNKIKDDDKVENKKLEIVKNVVPLYAPAILSGGLGVAAIISGYKIQSNRLAEMSAAYLMAMNGLNDYKNAVIDKFGEEKAEEIKKEVAEKQAERNPDATKDIIISNDGPEEIMQDSISGQYFKCTRDRVWHVLTDISHRLWVEDMIPASEYFFDVGISNASLGDDVGWMSGDRPEPSFTDFLLPDGRKAVLVTVDTNPAYRGYKNYY